MIGPQRGNVRWCWGGPSEGSPLGAGDVLEVAGPTPPAGGGDKSPCQCNFLVHTDGGTKGKWAV